MDVCVPPPQLPRPPATGSWRGSPRAAASRLNRAQGKQEPPGRCYRAGREAMGQELGGGNTGLGTPGEAQQPGGCTHNLIFCNK